MECRVISLSQDSRMFVGGMLPVPTLQTSCTQCNDPGVVQRKDRQEKEFHDQSDYR